MLFLKWLKEFKIIDSFFRLLKTIDTGFYFPLFIVFSFPFVFYFWGMVSSYLFLVLISFSHFLFLKINPYIKDSNLYTYLSLKKDFYKQNEKYKPLFKRSSIKLSQFFLFFCLYCSFVMPEIAINFFPIFIIALPIMISSVTIDILNIINRPRLPQKIFSYHPILQRRYSPTWDIILNKVVPSCIMVGKGLFQGYGVFVIGWKVMHGPLEIDPIRNSVINYYYKFPKNHLWTETSLSSWTIFQRTNAAQSLPYDETVKKFIAGENMFTQRIENAATTLVRRRTN